MGLLDLLRRRNTRRLSAKVESSVQALWSDPEDRRRVVDALLTYGVESYEHETKRVQLAILKLSAGDVAKALSAVAAAKLDYRDVLVGGAEYPREGGALWPLNVPLTESNQNRLDDVRKADRAEYEEWLKKSGK
jgi:hypothetical protein